MKLCSREFCSFNLQSSVTTLIRWGDWYSYRHDCIKIHLFFNEGMHKNKLVFFTPCVRLVKQIYLNILYSILLTLIVKYFSYVY